MKIFALLFICSLLGLSAIAQDNSATQKKPLIFADKMPQFPGGGDSLHQYLVRNVVYPITARANNVHGAVVLQFIVGADGTISNIKVLKGVEQGCTEEAIKVVKAMPHWEPGVNEGKPVAVLFNLPIRFELEGVGHKHSGTASHTQPERDGPTDDMVVVPDKMPQFPGGEDKLMSYIRSHIGYPYAAARDNVEGTVVIQFDVETNGTFTNIKTLNNVPGGCTEEVLNMIKHMPEWEPGLKDGKPVRAEYVLPVVFQR